MGEPPALPYHWLEVGTMLLDAASDDLVDPDQIRRLLKELREARTAKFRAGIDALDAAAMGGGGVALTGVGAMEVGEGRGFVTGVVNGLRYAVLLFDLPLRLLMDVLKRKIGASKEQARREQMAEAMANGEYDGTQDEDYMDF